MPVAVGHDDGRVAGSVRDGFVWVDESVGAEVVDGRDGLADAAQLGDRLDAGFEESIAVLG